jgi:hypothetical protein
MVTPDIGSGRSFGTAKLTVRTPVGRNCGTGTTCADAPPDVRRAATRAKTARGARRTRRDDAGAALAHQILELGLPGTGAERAEYFSWWHYESGLSVDEVIQIAAMIEVGDPRAWAARRP